MRLLWTKKTVLRAAITVGDEGVYTEGLTAGGQGIGELMGTGLAEGVEGGECGGEGCIGVVWGETELNA